MSSRQYWEAQAQELKRTVLTRTSAAATGWLGVATTLLGIFGTASVVVGPDAVDKLPSGSVNILQQELAISDLIIYLSLAAVAASFFAVWRLAKVAHRIPKSLGTFAGPQLAIDTRQKAKDAVNALNASRRAAMAAAILAVLAGVVSLLGSANAPSEDKASPTLLVWTETDGIVCGQLDGSTVGGVDLATSSVRGVLLVDACTPKS